MANNKDGGDNLGQGCCLFMVAIPLALFGLGFKFHLLWWILGVITFLIICVIISPSSSPDNKVIKPGEDLSNLSEEVANVLADLSNGQITDQVSQETFKPGDKAYLCHVHYLAYHEDSYQDIGRKCMECGNNTHIKEHTVPQPIASTNGGSDSSLNIEFTDIK